MLLIIVLICSSQLFSQKGSKSSKEDEDLKAEMAYLDSVEHAMNYQHGSILLDNDLAKITVPKGFKYLNSSQTDFVLTSIWGNPPGQNSMGMLLPENMGVTASESYAFIIEWDEMGYVKDDDADKINYDDLLEEMQEDVDAGSQDRVKEGYESIKLVGWAAKPFYDKTNKILHWAKELKFGNSSENTLNYNIRILGRKGVLILNAVASIKQLPLVNKDIKSVLNIVEFTDGNKYTDYKPSVDKLAAVGIGGLVAGKVLAKLGFLGLLAKFFAPLLKFGKLAIVAIGGGLSAIWRFITGRRKQEEDPLNDIIKNNSSKKTDE